MGRLAHVEDDRRGDGDARRRAIVFLLRLSGVKQCLLVSLLSVGIGFTLAACSGNDDTGAPASTTTGGPAATTGTGQAVIAPDGLGVAKFGDGADAAVAKLIAEFGAPQRDFAPPDCAPQITRSLEWDALHVDLNQTFVGYAYATAGGPPIRTAAGIGKGSTVAQLKSAYGSKLAVEEGIESSTFTITLPTGRIDGYVSGTEGSDTIESLYAGTVCGE
jgi:hypothetical protein